MTQNIDTCLRNLNDIDTQTLYAEGEVLEAYMLFDDKLNEMNMICEADGATKQKEIKKPLIVKLMNFIRKCIDKIIETISDILIKTKTLNADRISVPYEVTDILDDINKMINITKTLESYLKEDSHTVKPEDLTFLRSLTAKAVFNVDKVGDSKDKYLIKRDAWLKLRDKIREQLKLNKDMKRTFGNWDKIFAGEDSINADCLRELTKLYTRMTNANTKIMTSFTFSGMGPVLTKASAKKKDVDNAPEKELPEKNNK